MGGAREVRVLDKGEGEQEGKEEDVGDEGNNGVAADGQEDKGEQRDAEHKATADGLTPCEELLD